MMLTDLTKLCSYDRDHFRRPFACRGHTVATDGCMLLAVRGTFTDEKEGADAAAKLLARTLAAEPPHNVIATTVEALRAWAGSGRIDCAVCEGAGYHEGRAPCPVEDCAGGVVVGDCPCCGQHMEHRCRRCNGCGEIAIAGRQTCEKCEGSGQSRGYSRPTTEHGGVLDGVVVDRRRLANLLAPVSGDCVLWATGGPRDPIAIRGTGWDALLMGCVLSAAGLPVFSADKEGDHGRAR